MKDFFVADLTAKCEIRSIEPYRYDLLERIDRAADLITLLATHIWRAPDEFEIPLVSGNSLRFRWSATSESSGIATVLDPGKCLSVSLLCAGQDHEADGATINAFHSHVLRELHGTQYEPSFDVLQLRQRPLLATLGLFVPDDAADQAHFALADRCFAAAYFRRLGLA